MGAKFLVGTWSNISITGSLIGSILIVTTNGTISLSYRTVYACVNNYVTENTTVNNTAAITFKVKKDVGIHKFTRLNNKGFDEVLFVEGGVDLSKCLT